MDPKANKPKNPSQTTNQTLSEYNLSMYIVENNI